MRCARWLRCAAGAGAVATGSEAAVPPPASSEAASGAPSSKEGAHQKSAKGQQQQRAFGLLTFQKWQTYTVAKDEDRALLPPSVLYCGETLGPRPLIILDHSAPATASAADCKAAAGKFEPMLSALAWDHGAVYVPMTVEPDLQRPSVLGVSCRQVCAVLGALCIRWSHFLTHGYGALVAARMAASADYPHRIGTFLSLDTPLITSELVRNMEQRTEIAKAEEDVNVPEAELAFAVELLLKDLEAPLPCPASKLDKEVYEKNLFDAEAIFSRDGLVRDESRYVPVKELRGIHHPLQLIVPATNPVMDVTAHKEFFNIRRPATIKAAASHEELFTGRGAVEVAEAVSAWMNRFEPDVVIKRRYEQAAKEMTQLMNSAQSGDSGTSLAIGGDGKKKKEKKKG